MCVCVCVCARARVYYVYIGSTTGPVIIVDIVIICIESDELAIYI
jgi:hypothetical protein